MNKVPGLNSNVFFDPVGLPFSQVSSSIPFDSDAQAFITAASIADPTQQSAINTLVIDLKAEGLWTKMKVIYPFVGGTASTHKWNLKDPRDLDAAFRLSFGVGITHNSNGITGNGTTSYADTFVNPTTHLTLRDTHIALYSRVNVEEEAFDMGCGEDASNPSITLIIKYPGYGYITDQYNFTYNRISGANADATGFYLGSRTSATVHKFFKNGSQLGSTDTTSEVVGSMPNRNITIGAYNGFNGVAVFSTRSYAFSSIGSGLTAVEALAYYNIVQAFQTTLNRQV